jgi:hypothetical protein
MVLVIDLPRWQNCFFRQSCSRHVCCFTTKLFSDATSTAEAAEAAEAAYYTHGDARGQRGSHVMWSCAHALAALLT